MLRYDRAAVGTNGAAVQKYIVNDFRQMYTLQYRLEHTFRYRYCYHPVLLFGVYQLTYLTIDYHALPSLCMSIYFKYKKVLNMFYNLFIATIHK
jgi:hypothetical protein